MEPNKAAETVLQLIKNSERDGVKGKASWDQIIEEAVELQGLSIKEAENALYTLLDDGCIMEPILGIVRLT